MKQLKKGFLSYGIALILCTIVAIVRYLTRNDIMSLTVFKSKILGDMTGEQGVYSLWPISHFILYVCLGYLSPSFWWLWILIGVGWELFEYTCGILVRTMQSNESTASLGKKAEAILMPQYGEQWVSGCQSDILFNLSGLVLGLLISKCSSKQISSSSNVKITYYRDDSSN